MQFTLTLLHRNMKENKPQQWVVSLTILFCILTTESNRLWYCSLAVPRAATFCSPYERLDWDWDLDLYLQGRLWRLIPLRAALWGSNPHGLNICWSQGYGSGCCCNVAQARTDLIAWARDEYEWPWSKIIMLGGCAQHCSWWYPVHSTTFLHHLWCLPYNIGDWGQ